MNCEEISAILYNWQQKAKGVSPDAALIVVNSAARRNEEFFPEKVPAVGRA
jgi:hypothetical protein